MKVSEIKNPIIAYSFIANAGGTNYYDLSSEVIADGGTIEQIADEVVVININSMNITLHLGFTVVIDGTGISKVMKYDQFTRKYTEVKNLDTQTEIIALNERLTALENKLNKNKVASK